MTRCKSCHTDHILDAKGRCAICGEPLPSNMRKYCTPECAHIGAMKSELESKKRRAESKKRRAERMKNYDKL